MRELQKNLVLNTEGHRFHLSAGSSFTDIRKTHWKNSRLALTRCLVELGIVSSLESSAAEDLKVKDHHHLVKHPGILVSLSHTRGAGAAVAAKKDADLYGVGIDVERADRKIKDGVLEKYNNPDDEGLSPLELWCAKEAAFKAASYYWRKEKTFILKDITVTSTTLTLGDNILSSTEFTIDQTCSGTIEFSTQKDFLITLALVHKLF